MNKTKLYKNINFLFRIVICLTVAWFIYDRLSGNTNALLPSILTISYFYLLITLLALTAVNWGIETVKWQRLTRKVQPIGFLQAVRSVMFGTTLGLITPNRLGELGGRILYVQKRNRTEVMMINVFCSFSQMLVTLLFGLPALWLLRNEIYLYDKMDLLSGNYYLVLIFLLIAIILSITFIRLSFFKKLKEQMLSLVKNIRTFRLFPAKDWGITLLLSGLRYAVFSLQYYLLLLFFEVNVPFPLALQIIAAIFLVKTAVPGGFITELGVRTSAALLLFGIYSDAQAGILAASLSLWMINILLPALAGITVIRRFNLLPSPAVS